MITKNVRLENKLCFAGYTSEPKYRLPVETVEPFDAYGVKGIKIGTTFSIGDADSDSIKRTLYATEPVYGNYVLK